MAGLISIRSGASTALAAALAISLLVNAGVALLYLGQRDTVTALRRDLQHSASNAELARASADACTQSVEDLRTAADAIQALAQQARDVAARRAGQNYARADQILTTPPAVPDDACASAQARVADILVSRERRAAQ